MFSVITPTYNGLSKGLKRSIASVLQLDCISEYIIVVDASTDESYKYCKKLQKSDKRIEVVQNQKNLGWPISTANALALTKGKWTSIHSDDDWFLPNMKNLVDFILKHNLDLGYSKYAVGQDEKKKIDIFTNSAWPQTTTTNLNQEFYKLLLHDCYIGRCFIKTKILRNFFNTQRLENLFTDFGKPFTALDFDCYLGMSLKNYKFGFLNEITNIWTKREQAESGYNYLVSGQSAAENSYLFNKYFDNKIHEVQLNYLNQVFQRIKFLFHQAKKQNRNIEKIFETHFLKFSKNIQGLRSQYV